MPTNPPLPQRLPTVPYPRLDRLFRVGERLWQQRADVRQVHPDPASWGFWCWLMFPGAAEHGEVQAELYPLPDAARIARVAGNVPPIDFVRNGVVDAMRVHRCLEQAGFDFGRAGRVLDFGCGCGRLLRVMARHADQLQLVGADVDDDALRWCAEALDFAAFAPLPMQPPSGFASGTFDAVYAYSVFTHFDAQGTAAWIDELARITRPGAALVLTTGGRRLVEHFLAPDQPRVPTPAVLRARLPELASEGFLFFPYQKIDAGDQAIRAVFDQFDMQRYGMTFLLEPYIRRHWLRQFELVAFHPAPDDWQDFVVLRRR